MYSAGVCRELKVRLQHKLCVQSCGLVYKNCGKWELSRNNGVVYCVQEQWSCLWSAYIGGETPGDYPSTHK